VRRPLDRKRPFRPRPHGEKHPPRPNPKPTPRTAPIPILKAVATECVAVIIALSDCGSCTSCSTHDLNDLDLRGIPGVSVLTTEFRDAFAKQCGAIGYGGASVFVPHPMQNRSTAELHGFADANGRTCSCVPCEATSAVGSDRSSAVRGS